MFVYDPEVPVTAPGGAQALSGSFDQAGLELGNNLLVYTSPPVVRDAEVFGQPRIRLFAATSAEHADFSAKLVRVKQDGRAEFLCIGIARSSWLFRDTGYAADQIHAWEFSLEPIAKAKIPIIHVVGDADDVVPVAENTAVLKERCEKLGGHVEVIAKPGVGHHPHSLADPTPIVDFILKNALREQAAK